MKKLLLVLVILSMTMTLAFATGARQPAASTAITVEIFDRGTGGGNTLAHDNAWTNWIKQKVKTDLNLDVTFIPVGRWTENQDIINLMASGSAPDLSYTYNNDMIQMFRDQGGIVNLAPYIDSHLSDLKVLLGEDTALGGDFIYRQRINTGPMAGHVYSIQAARVALAQRNIFIRQDWLSRLGIAVPTNIQQFHDALIAFRDRDPGGVGANRIVPLGQDRDVQWGLADLIMNSVATNMSNRDRWINSLAERYHTFPGYKEGVRTMNTWYNERLIYPDFPLLEQGDDFYNMLKSGVVGAFGANWDLPFRQDYKINEDLAQNVPGAEFIAVDLNLNNKSMMDKAGLYMFIPSFSRNREGALQYLNWLSKYENYHYLQVGELGRNHTLVNGVPNVAGRPEGDPWRMNSGNNIDYTMPLNGVQMGDQDLNSRVLALSYGAIPPQRIVDAYAISIKGARASVVYPVPTTVNQYADTLQTKSRALLAQSITARTTDFDRVYDEGMTDWMASGAQEMLDERSRLWPVGQP